MQLPNYLSREVRTTILGSNQLERTIATLLDYMEACSIAPQLELVPEYVIDQLCTPGPWSTEEDIANNDHILSTLRLTKMDGPKLRHYRRSVHLFLRRYEQTFAFHKLDITCSVTQEAMLRTFIKREGSKQDNNYKHELLALTRLFDLADQAKLENYGISIQGKLAAFIICEPMNSTWMIGHFWKADATINGIYCYLMHCVAQRFLRQGYEYFNIQQDLGIQGLRAFKESLAPVLYLRKYTLIKH